MHETNIDLEIQKLESRIHHLEQKSDECCSKSEMETRARTVWLLESIKEKVDGLVKDRDKIMDILSYHSKLLYMAVGALVILEILGGPDKLREIFTGG